MNNKKCRIGKNTVETSIKNSFEEIRLMRSGKMPERTMKDLYRDISKWLSSTKNGKEFI